MNAMVKFGLFAVLIAALAFVPAVEDDAADAEIVFLSGDVTSALGSTESQKVIIDGDMAVKDGGLVTVMGELLVPEGVTVTIEDGGYFLVYGDAIIDGTIISKGESGLQIVNDGSKDVLINGTVLAMGVTTGQTVTAVYINASGEEAKAIVNGTLNVGINATMKVDGVAVAAQGKISVFGTIEGAFDLAGYAYFESSDSQNHVAISFTESSAVVDVKAATGTIVISDEDMFAYSFGGVQYFVGYAGDEALKAKALAYDADAEVGCQFPWIHANGITLLSVKNVKITETVATATAYDKSNSTTKVYAETKMFVAPLDAAAPVEAVNEEVYGASEAYIRVTDGDTVCFGTMTVYGVNVLIDTEAEATVSGTVTFPLQPAGEKLTVKGVLNVDGTVEVLRDAVDGGIAISGVVSAAYYKVLNTDDSTYNHYYTIFRQAIDAKISDITILGTLIIEKDTVVPANTRVAVNGFGPYSLVVKEGATFRLEDCSKFYLTGSANIEGAFIIDNIDYGVTLDGTIFADVAEQSGVCVKYMNLRLALEKAEAGDEIRACYPVDGTVIIDRNLVLPAGVTFNNTSSNRFSDFSAGVRVMNGAVFTVNGTLLMDNEDLLMPQYPNGWNYKTPARDSDGLKDYSVIKIGPNGLINFESLGTPGGIYEEMMVDGTYIDIFGGHSIMRLEVHPYIVFVTSSVGVGDLYIDGKAMKNYRASNEFILMVEAGVHSFSYNLVPGATGAPMITTVDSKTVVDAGLSFAVNEENYDGSCKNIRIKGTYSESMSGLVYAGGDIGAALSFTEDQTVVVDRDMCIHAGGSLTVVGGIYVPSEVTITISGGELVINGDAMIDGTIVSESSGGLVISPQSDKYVVIHGDIQARGDGSGSPIEPLRMRSMILDNAIVVYGSVSVSEEAIAVSEYVYYTSNADLEVSGKIVGSIISEANVVINGEAELDIHVSEPCARTTIDELSGWVCITDSYMHAYTYGGKGYYMEEVAPYYFNRDTGIAIAYDPEEDTFYDEYGQIMKAASNGVLLYDVKNVFVSVNVTTGIAYDKVSEINRMYAKTQIAVYPADDSESIGSVEYGDPMIEVMKGQAAFSVATTVDGVTIAVNSGAELIVSEILCTGEDEIIVNGSVSTAHYAITESEAVNNYYATLQSAIDNGAKDIDYIGQLVISEDLVLPSSVKLVTDSSIGDSVVIKKDAVFTVKDQAIFTNERIVVVEGTMIVENYDFSMASEPEMIITKYVKRDGAYRMFTSDPSQFGTMSMTISDEKNFGRGTTDVTLSIDVNPGISSLRLVIRYDASVMTLTGAVSSELMQMTEGDIVSVPYGLYFEAPVTGEDMTSTGLLATLSFSLAEGVDEGTYPITIEWMECFRDNGDPIAVDVIGGSVTVVIGTPGDLNGDGRVDGNDSLLLRKYIANWNVELFSNPDVNGDGKVSLADSLHFRKYLAGQAVILY